MPSVHRAPGLPSGLHADLIRELPGFLARQRWFGGKARSIHRVSVLDTVQLTTAPRSHLIVLKVRYTSGPPERYLLALSCRNVPMDDGNASGRPPLVKSRTRGNRVIVCHDGLYDHEVHRRLLALITRRQRIRGGHGSVIGERGPALPRVLAQHEERDLPSACRVLGSEQSNTALLYGDALFLKVFRKLDEGIHPDVEFSRFLSETAAFTNVPPFAGTIEYQRRGHLPVALGVLQGFVPNVGDGWRYALELLTPYFERAGSASLQRRAPGAPASPFTVARTGWSSVEQRLIGAEATEMAVLLGRRTGELHRALAADRRDPAFAPARCTLAYQRALARDGIARAKETYRLLSRSLAGLPVALKHEVRATLRLRNESLAKIRRLGAVRLSAPRIRCHGDYHLGQVLYTGNDFVIIDFEGEPTKPLAARRGKHPPLRDVAGMMRSFHYVAYAALFQRGETGRHLADLWPWAHVWYATMAGVFLRAYFDTLARSSLLPEDPAETVFWLETFLLDKALYEAAYELNHRPDWLRIPLAGIREVITRSGRGSLRT
ncbi:MAG: putative maltokinase [Nitrospirota bacterium]